MLLLVPGYPGEAYFSRGRIQYGCLPLLLSLGCLAFAGRLWVGAATERRNRRVSIGWSALLAAMVVATFYGVLILIAGHRAQ